MLGKTLKDYAQRLYDSRICLPGNLRREIERKLEECTADEQVLMKFFYGTMPFRDAGEYEFEVFLGFVKHSLMLCSTIEWCRKLPEDIFLHHVLYYRINSENIEDCRRFFYEQLIDRIKGRPLLDAVLEINYWCAENGAYEASDIRTISPLTMYRSGRGRCGEESTFAVTAFRSVGIPARQVYTPKWAHCDDNHAWVEVFVDGRWHFLGACEPEETLDKGWFVNAASRALMVHTRNFSDYGCSRGTSLMRQEEALFYQNITPSYTRTAELQITVTGEDRKPVENARVLIEVLNGAEYGRIAVLSTDAQGKASLRMGIGTVHLWAVKGTKIGEIFVYIGKQDDVRLILREEKNQAASGTWMDVDFKAPKESGCVCPVHLTRRQKEENHERIRAAAVMRAERIDKYYKEEAAERYPEEKEILRLAGGNFCQVYQFLERDGNPDRRVLLHSLSEKDYKDVKADILETHLKGASRYRAEWEEKGELKIYSRYILCPRIFFEEMTSYREGIEGYFSEGEKAEFRENPGMIWSYIREQITYNEKEDYSTLFSTPMGTLRLKFGNPVSQRILCTAVCRTLGIPARLNPASQEVELYKDGSFVKISGVEEGTRMPEKAALILKRSTEEEWSYNQNWTIGQYRHGYFVTLDYHDVKFDGEELRLKLEPGFYRILTSNRLPGGDQLASECKICLNSGQRLNLELRMRKGHTEELLVSNQLEDFEIKEKGKKTALSALTASGVYLLVFLKPGEEPSEHVLNEMNAQQESIKAMNAGLCFILEDHKIQETPAWKKAVKAFPEAKIVSCSFDDAAGPAARRMYVDPDKLPLLLLVNPGLNGIYACSGYNVGSVKLILELLKVNQIENSFD